MPPDREEIARRLRGARENRGLSQHAVAKKLGVSRTLVAMVELGHRIVTDKELLQFGSLYGKTFVELKGTQVSEDHNPVTTALIKVAPELATDEMQRLIHGVLGPLMAALDLERMLNRPRRTGPPSYTMPSPRTPADAIGQGERSAERERQRLGLHEQPIGEIADLVGNQGVHVLALELPDRMSGLFMQHSSIGSVIVVNANLDAARQRLTIAHGYAHAVIEPSGTIRVCTHANAKELIERRADAFAGALLLPASAVQETVRAMGKGQPSRRVQWVFDTTTEHSVRAEERSTPGSQVLTFLDAAWIAKRFGVDYKVAISRLLGLALLSDADVKRLLRPKFVELAGEWLTLFRSRSATPHPAYPVSVLSDLNAEWAYIAVEAFRRGLITKADLADDAVTLSLLVPGLSGTKLLEFAEAAR
ncbi:MAG TPA: XRE family transcriptional regulator [Vicinamibacterales bacterium]|jgi:transcriptional regulator with XRE-family HTH domain